MTFLDPHSFENGEVMARMLGSFWSMWFNDQEKLKDILDGKGNAEYENYLQLKELTDSISKSDVPIFGKRYWRFVDFTSSEQSASDSLKNLYGTAGVVYGDPILYGQKRDSKYYSYPITEDMVGCSHLYNRVLDPSFVMTRGIDFDIDPTLMVINFYTDPLENELLSIKEVINDDGEVTDTIIGLWANNALVDKQHIWIHFGYVLNIWQKSSKYYRQFISALWDQLVLGPSKTAYKLAISAVTGIPVALGDEVVETILTEDHAMTIITDLNVYEYVPTAVPTVAVGDAVQQGSTMTDGFQVLIPTPTTDWSGISALSVGKQFMHFDSVNGPIVFENKDVALEYLSKDIEGRTIAQFEVHGVATDVSAFWSAVHKNGIADKTLANYLDTRADPIDEPSELDLPELINPFEFMMENIFANNAYVVHLKPAQFATDAPGLSYIGRMRLYMEAHTTQIIFIEMDPVTDYYSSSDLVDTVEFMGGLYHSDVIDTSEPAGYEDTGMLVDHGPVFSFVPELCN